MRIALLLAAVLASSTLVRADDRAVVVDPHADFSAIKTFTMHAPRVATGQPDLQDEAYARTLEDAVRHALLAKGLKEVTDNPDVVVDCSLMSTDGSFGSDGQGRRRGASTGFDAMSFTAGTISVDLSRPGADEPLWHGTYRDPNDSAAKIAAKTPEFVAKLLAAYPPKAKSH